MQNPYSNNMVQDAEAVPATGLLMTRVFGWMSLGLILTALVALVTASTGLWRHIFGSPVFFGLIIGEFALVWGLSAAINRLSTMAAGAMFLLYSALNGLTLSVVLLVYTTESVTGAFFVSAGMFGVMFFLGYVTKHDLSGLGSMLVMALVGLIIASVVNLFVASGPLYWVITYAGVLIFAGLTAWDAQKVRLIGEQGLPDALLRRYSIVLALTLYLDFVNLFLLMLRLLGRRR